VNVHPYHSNLLQFAVFEDCLSLFHFTTTCTGGCSKGNYATFNLSEYSGGDLLHVAGNRRQLAAAMGIASDDLLFPFQTHGDRIAFVDSDFLSLPVSVRNERLHGADALITDCPRVCIGVTTADCVPVLFFDSVRHVLAVVHAGWRGTVARIVSKTVMQMTKRYGCKPVDLKAGIAPSISQEHFEVGEEVVSAFSGAGFHIGKLGRRHSETGKMHIDLCCANRQLLIEAGVPAGNIEESGLCTYARSDLFFSARRQGVQSGRMVTGGMLY
jgi:YfiH family protein